MLKKFFSILAIVVLMLGMYGNVNAAELKTSLDIIQKASEIKYLEDDQGYISKTIVDSNSNTGEVTIELKLSNTAKEKEQTQNYENTEVYIIVSENIVNDDEKLSKYIDNIKKLSSKIFKANSKTKIGVIGITGTIEDRTIDEDGRMIVGDKDEGTVNGIESNSEIVAELTNNLDTIINGIQNMNASKASYYTNLQAAIRLANKSYSNNTNKILISLYDNVPSIAIGVKANISYGGLSGNTMEEALIAQHEKIATYTKNEILKLKDANVSFIILRPDDTSYDEEWYNLSTGEKALDFDGSPYVQKLYGTIDSPTYGKMYSFNDSNIDTIITENIYQEVKELIQPNIYNVKIIDYFPSDIIENFDFSYVGNPSIGTATDNINTENNTIEWDIGTLKGDEVATLKYKLKIKDMENTDLLNKTIATNEKVVLTYKDTEAKDYTVILTSSPKIQLSEVKEESTDTVSYNPTTNTTDNPTTNTTDNAIETMEKDNTTAKGTLPQTGVSMTITVIIIAITLVSIIMYKKYNYYKNLK